MAVKFEDFSMQVKGAISNAVQQALEEVGGELEAATKRNQTRVDTGVTKGYWRHVTEPGKVTVGNPLQNAIWEEYGTGEYALGGNGRKGGWRYRDEARKWHYTKGKKPLRPLHKAFTKGKAKYKGVIEARLKELN